VEEGSGTGYLKTVCDYVHMNPVRARLMGPEQKLAAYRWSSYEAYLGARAKGDKEKVAVAVRLRRETTMTLKWVAKRWVMGSWSNVSNLLAAAQKKPAKT
jgi:hypothetical protein